MSGKEVAYTEPTLCGHCGNKAPMKLVSEYGQTSFDEEIGSESGYFYEILVCPSCSGVIFRRYFWHDAMEGPKERSPKTLYPLVKNAPSGLPDSISRAWEAATRVKIIDANAHGVLLRRLMELVCLDRSASGKDLNDKLADLANKREIPSKLVDVAKGLRQMGNIGAHALLGDLTAAESPILEDLARAILDYVYTAPFLAKQAQDRYSKLKGKSATKKKN